MKHRKVTKLWYRLMVISYQLFLEVSANTLREDATGIEFTYEIEIDN